MQQTILSSCFSERSLFIVWVEFQTLSRMKMFLSGKQYSHINFKQCFKFLKYSSLTQVSLHILDSATHLAFDAFSKAPIRRILFIPFLVASHSDWITFYELLAQWKRDNILLRFFILMYSRSLKETWRTRKGTSTVDAIILKLFAYCCTQFSLPCTQKTFVVF